MHVSSLLHSFHSYKPKKQILLPEPLCHSRITAATTEGFGCYVTTKALKHILGSL